MVCVVPIGVAADPEPFLSLGLADTRWLDKALPLLICQEARCSTDGESLTHWDLRSDNICVTERRAIFVDWNHACVSNPILDLGFWLPSLAYEGGPEPERILPGGARHRGVGVRLFRRPRRVVRHQ
jgi:hypothetical protein